MIFLVIGLSILHGPFHMEVSVAALFGAGLIILLNKMDIVEIWKRKSSGHPLSFS